MYLVMTYFIIKNILIVIYLFYSMYIILNDKWSNVFKSKKEWCFLTEGGW